MLDPWACNYQFWLNSFYICLMLLLLTWHSYLVLCRLSSTGLHCLGSSSAAQQPELLLCSIKFPSRLALLAAITFSCRFALRIHHFICWIINFCGIHSFRSLYRARTAQFLTFLSCPSLTFFAVLPPSERLLYLQYKLGQWLDLAFFKFFDTLFLTF